MESPTLSIIKVNLADVHTLLALSKKTFFDFFGPLNDPANMEAYASIAFKVQKLQDELINPDSEFYFAILGDKVAGYLKLNYGPAQTEFQDDNALEVERIYVLGQHHGKKIGHQLLDFAIKQALNKKMLYIWLGVWEHNNRALGFYEQHGFKVFGSHDFMLGTDKQTDLLMKKELK